MDYAKSRRNPDAVAIPSGPHACALLTDPKWTPAYPGESRISLAVGVENGSDHRFLQKPVVVGGAKAYEISGESGRDCVLDLPVSHTFSIELRMDRSSGTNACEFVEDYGARAVAKLANPDTFSVDTAKRPFSAWDGCAFVAKLFGQNLTGYTLAPDGTEDPFSGCRATSREQTRAGLKAGYDKWRPNRGDRLTRIGDKDAIVRDGGNCDVLWHQGPSGSANEWFGSLIFDLVAEDCATATRLAAEAIQLAGQAPESGAVQPQRPLLYGPDENDTGKVGACVDLINSDCSPYRGGITVPPTFEAAANASRVNQAVQCEAFQEAVKAAYGETLAPVTWGTHCMFVEPTHTLLVYVDIDGQNRPAEYGTGSSNWIDRQVKQVGGKQAVTFRTADGAEYDVYYSPYNEISRRGNLHLHLQAYPPRGVRYENAVPLDPVRTELAERVVALVDRKYFGSR
ncbi:MAG TPA: hypothetical protein VJT49_23455 [Amycolatopsis sp.]|uniref:hypothetical protein n=1 Tax=Amycolatopsis sp. TaxID=37632 RepID=UPI002B487CEA|nr:hypothetical protein [Amycolatopsis sp.]HKS48013.1 hypothetical protein [Amycolatopsis sp.]